jgi:hypothetical protein
MLDAIKKEELLASSDMEPVDGSVVIDVPVDEFWSCFTRPDQWPVWNDCFFWVRNHDLTPGERLVWAFQPIRRWYLYKMPAVATIVEREEHRRVTWEVGAFPGFYALHTYYMEDAGAGKTRFGSWEQAMGPGFRWMKKFWLAHFWFVNESSLAGARRLEAVYRRSGSLDPELLDAQIPEAVA